MNGQSVEWHFYFRMKPSFSFLASVSECFHYGGLLVKFEWELWSLNFDSCCRTNSTIEHLPKISHWRRKILFSSIYIAILTLIATPSRPQNKASEVCNSHKQTIDRSSVRRYSLGGSRTNPVRDVNQPEVRRQSNQSEENALDTCPTAKKKKPNKLDFSLIVWVYFEWFRALHVFAKNMNKLFYCFLEDFASRQFGVEEWVFILPLDRVTAWR